MLRTINIKDLVSEYQGWYLDPGWERFGQHMYNTYFHDTGPWPELFYEEDTDKAFALIANTCLKEIT